MALELLIELEFRSAGFCEGRKTGQPGEKCRVWESNPGHVGALTTTLSLLPIYKNIGTLSVQELFFQLIGRLGVELGVSHVGMVYFMG